MGLVSWTAQGRMGNWLWQAASVLSYCLEHGLTFSAPCKTGSDKWSPLYCKHLIHPEMNDWFNADIHIIEEQAHYKPLPFHDNWQNYNILFQGYFQATPYIEGHRNEILKAFNFPYEFKSDVCSIHGRFGDYLTIEGKHIIIDENYLRKAMAYVTENTGITRFKVFSDDLDYFKAHFGGIYDFEYSTNTNEVDDLVEISCCHSNIGSSSTFSFWGAYLNQNPNKICIFQQKWYQDGWSDGHGVVDTSEIILKEWIKL